MFTSGRLSTRAEFTETKEVRVYAQGVYAQCDNVKQKDGKITLYFDVRFSCIWHCHFLSKYIFICYAYLSLPYTSTINE